jgi:starch synthase
LQKSFAMKILLASSEMAPLARTGGLGDVLEALSAALQRRHHEVSVILPLYRIIRENKSLKIRSTGVRVTVQVGGKRFDMEIMECSAPNQVQVFLVRRDEYFDRSGLYGSEGRTYEDNAERFIAFSKGVVELARRLMPAPDILHVNDWQTALVPVLIKDLALPLPAVLTIHNINYQGNFWGVDFGQTNLPGHYFSASGLEFYGQMNLLKGGIIFADAVTTVSERYAREIQTPEFGGGLDAIMREHAGKLRGILNGADYNTWNPATDPHIAQRYTPDSLEGKSACRKALIQELELEENPAGAVFAMVTRLAEQKGIDLLLPVLDRLLSDDVRLVVLGEGESSYERELAVAVKKHRGKFSFVRAFDDRLAHMIQAGADITLIPSLYEPCGLAAMYSLKYGTIPVVRAAGGLHQIVQDYDPTSGTGTGFFFYDYSPEAFWDAIGRAKKNFRDKETWVELMRRAMECDFSWDNAATEYEEIYERLVEKTAPAEPSAP